MYHRTSKPYSLGEILYIEKELVIGSTVDDIAQQVKRSPEALRYKFLQYRAMKTDGSYSHKTVKSYKALQD